MVDLLERDVERKGHERQEVVGDARNDRDGGREEPSVVPEDAHVAQEADDGPLIREDRLPGERPNQVRDEERRNDEKQQEVLPPAATERDPVDEWVADQEGNHRDRKSVV